MLQGDRLSPFAKNSAVPQTVWNALAGGSTPGFAKSTAICIGDSLGDAEMAFSPHFQQRVRLGLLNYNEDALRDKYEKAFDVVFQGDGPAWPILECVEKLLDNEISVAELRARAGTTPCGWGDAFAASARAPGAELGDTVM